jgi:DNA-binding beta-propeller fold protein YncE
MTSRLWRSGIMVAFLGFASILPAAVGAQSPVYLTQWGSYGSGDGQFNYPTGVATDAAGNVYVTDSNNHRVQKFTGAGTYLTQWGSFGNGDAQFIGPSGVATDAAGNVYVVDQNNHRVQKFTSTGVYLTQWGSFGSGGNGRFYYPQGVATDAAGNVYVTDQACGRVQKFTNTGTYITQWGGCGSSPGQFNGSAGVATDAAGDIYVADQYNHRIQEFTGTGTFITQWGSFGSGDGQFEAPYGVATDAAGNVYVTEWNNHRIQKFTSTGAYLTQWGSFGTGDGQFSTPAGVATNTDGDIYVAEQGNHRVQKFGPASTPIVMSFDFTPNALNLASQGLWITGFLEPLSPLAASDIDIASIRLNGTVPVDPTAPTALGDHDGDGVSDLTVKFSRAAVELTLPEGDDVPVVVTGKLGSQSFSGTDHIRVRRTVVSAPAASSHLAASSVTQVRWQVPSDVTVESVALLYSLDGGSTWSLIARGQLNTGSYDWTVPDVQTDHAKVAVVLVESADETGYSVDGVLGVSEAFSIAAPVSVSDLGPSQFALRGVTPNPAQHELRVSFSLRDSKAATMAVFDVSGRQLAGRRVDGMGPGWHTVALGRQSNLPAGLYVIRLTQGGRSLTTRAAVIP